MPIRAAADLASEIGGSVKKTRDLALASLVRHSPDARILTVAALLKLDTGLRRLDANHYLTAEDIINIEGYIRSLRNRNEEEFSRDRVMMDAVIESLFVICSDDQRPVIQAKLDKAVAKCQAMDVEKARKFMTNLARKSAREGDDAGTPL
ncbi:hypothetical protein VTK26DRAFT_7560 [Humicola hyalothermophila]